MELGTSTSVMQKAVALRQLKTFRTLANRLVTYGHQRGRGVSREQGASPKWKPHESTWIVVSLGPGWVLISLSVAEI